MLIERKDDEADGKSESVTTKSKDAKQADSSKIKATPNKREMKQHSKKIQNEKFHQRHLLSGPTLYHCCLALMDGKGHCPATLFDSHQIWKHIRTKKHGSQPYPVEEGLPWGAQPCTGRDCKYCKRPQKSVKKENIPDKKKLDAQQSPASKDGK